MIHFKPVLSKKYLKKNGEYPIYLLINERNSNSSIALDISTKEKAWNPDRQRVTSKDILHLTKNTKINRALTKAAAIVGKFEREQRPLSLSEFARQFKNASFGSDCFFQFADDYMKEHAATVKPSTLKVINDQVNKIRAFRPELKVSEIDQAFLFKYEAWLRDTRANNRNTTIKALRVVKQFIIRAHKTGIIPNNPFVDFPLGKIEGHRQYLTETELRTLAALIDEPSFTWNQKNVVRYFLFACYTGLTFGDVADLRKRDIDMSGEMPLIDTTRKKTGTNILVPVRDEAMKLIPTNVTYPAQKIFKTFTNQSTNRHLKTIATVAGIKKVITFHSARHTFATLSKSKGIDYDVIAKYLGHTDTKTTRIYAKYEKEFLISEAKKWN
jgi:integrase/recombinase XerC